MRTFQQIVDELLGETAATRTTLRLDTPGLDFPAVAEALAPGAVSIRSNYSIAQGGDELGIFMLETGRLVIQENCETAEMAPPGELMGDYGVKAQMLGPVRRGAKVNGWLSVHSTKLREWGEKDVNSLQRAIGAVEALLAELPAPGKYPISDGGVNVFECGAGPPIVLVHGLESTSLAWKYELSELAGRYHLTAMDCHGLAWASDECDTLASINRTASELDALVRFRDFQEITLIGSSLGCLVCIGYCHEFGTERLRGLGLIDMYPALLTNPGGTERRRSAEGIATSRSLWETDRPGFFTKWHSAAFDDPKRYSADIERLVEASIQTSSSDFNALVELLRPRPTTQMIRVDIPIWIITTRLANLDLQIDECPSVRFVISRKGWQATLIEEAGQVSRRIAEFASRDRPI